MSFYPARHHPGVEIKRLINCILRKTPDGNYHGVSKAVIVAHTIYQSWVDRQLAVVNIGRYNGLRFTEISDRIDPTRQLNPTRAEYLTAYQRVKPLIVEIFHYPGMLWDGAVTGRVTRLQGHVRLQSRDTINLGNNRGYGIKWFIFL